MMQYAKLGPAGADEVVRRFEEALLNLRRVRETGNLGAPQLHMNLVEACQEEYHIAKVVLTSLLSQATPTHFSQLDQEVLLEKLRDIHEALTERRSVFSAAFWRRFWHR